MTKEKRASATTVGAKKRKAESAELAPTITARLGGMEFRSDTTFVLARDKNLTLWRAQGLWHIRYYCELLGYSEFWYWSGQVWRHHVQRGFSQKQLSDAVEAAWSVRSQLPTMSKEK